MPDEPSAPVRTPPHGMTVIMEKGRETNLRGAGREGASCVDPWASEAEYGARRNPARPSEPAREALAPPSPRIQARRGKHVSLWHLQVGDLVFYGSSSYYHHVAIYAGRGRIIHAPHSGAVVSYSRVGDAATAVRLIGN